MQKYAFFCLIYFIVACKGTNKSENKVEKIALVYCECTTDLVALNQKMMQSFKDSTIKVDFQQMQLENQKVQDCLVTVVAKYGKLSPVELNQVKSKVVVNCPNLAQLNPEQLENQLKETLGE
jgi:hypothetical protein